MTKADEYIDFWCVTSRAWRFRWIVFAAACTLALVAAVIIVMLPKTYESTATVQVTRPMTTNPLVRGPMSMDEYQQLAHSEPVLTALQEELQHRGTTPSSIDREALSAIRYSTTPWIGLRVVSADPVRAQAIANAWASVLLSSEANAVARQSDVTDVLEHHREATADMSRVDNDLSALQEKHLKIYAEAEVKYDESQKASDLAMKRQSIVAIEIELLKTRAAIEGARARTAQLERELKERRLPDRGSDPFVSSLAEEISRERSISKGLQATEAVLQAEVAGAKTDLVKLSRELSDAKLALARLSAAQRSEAAALNRLAATARARYDRLDETYVATLAAKGQPRTYLTVRSAASLPQEPRPRPFRHVALAFTFGLVASMAAVFVVALIGEAQSRRFDTVAHSTR